MRRECGDCQLCCRLLPVPPLEKKAGQRCKHQKFGKGCSVYNSAGMPMECSLWNCRWLVNDDTADMPRPDRCGYVIDVMPDYITWVNNETGEQLSIEVVQVWCDPKRPDAHHDPHLRDYIVRRARDGIAALIRYNARDALTVFAPPFDEDGEWHEIEGQCNEHQHSLGDVMRALGGAR